VIAVDVNHPDIDIDYLAIALREAVERGGFLYEAKLFAARVRQLGVEIPITAKGDFDIVAQQKTAAVIRRFDTLLARLQDLGVQSASVRIV
jgi:hypothetical protein